MELALHGGENSLNVLLINQSDIVGGAAIAGHRLYSALRKRGVDVKMLVDIKNTIDNDIATCKPRGRIESRLIRLAGMGGLSYVAVNSFGLTHHEFYQQADILNLHNLHGGYFNYLLIPRLTKMKPAVFTLHDMWSFTGHCSHSHECERWISGCGRCPHPEIYPPIHRDNTWLELKLKKWSYSRSRLAIVCPSKWLTNQAKRSILKDIPIYYIANGIDTEVYRPRDKEQCRSVLGIPKGKRVIMTGAQSLHKVFDLLSGSLQRLPASIKNDTVLLTIGHGGENLFSNIGIETINLGYVGSDLLKSVCYSAADLFIFSTRADNVPLVLQESMACGTAMVSFNVGGVLELVRSGETGYLAEAENCSDFSKGIEVVLQDQKLRDRMGQNCRNLAIKEYSLELQAKKYIELLHAVLNGTAGLKGIENHCAVPHC